MSVTYSSGTAMVSEDNLTKRFDEIDVDWFSVERQLSRCSKPLAYTVLNIPVYIQYTVHTVHPCRYIVYPHPDFCCQHAIAHRRLSFYFAECYGKALYLLLTKRKTLHSIF